MSVPERRAADDRFRALLDAAVDAIILIDSRGLITRFNRAAERLFLRQQDEVIGQNVSILMTDTDAHRHDGYLDRYRRTGEARIIGIGREVVGRRRDGSQFPLELAVGEFRHGDERGFVGILRDLSERERLRETEANARREIEELNARLTHASRLQLLGEMASGIAHEVNQPITAIAAYASACRRMLEAGELADAELRDILEKIAVQAERAGQVIGSLRKLARRQDAVQAPVDLNRLVQEVRKLVEFDLRASGWRLELDLADNLPAVQADGVQVQQVLLNLIRNGIEAMLEHAHRDFIQVRTLAGHGEVLAQVRDGGPGIRGAAREHLFEPFRSTKPDGLGLGLSICQSIVQSHSGRLELLDDGQPGACFVLGLPVAE